MQLVTAGGDVVEISRDDDPQLMDAITVGLGAFGIVTRLTLAVEPTFIMRQTVYEHLRLSTAISHLEEIMADGYSVSMFTTWRHDEIEQLWRKDRSAVDVDDGGRPRPARRASARSPPLASCIRSPSCSAQPCTEQMGVPGPWHERLPHFRHGVHAEQRRGVAVGAVRRRVGRAGGLPDPARARRRAGSGAAGLRGARRRRRHAVAEPVLPTRLRSPFTSRGFPRGRSVQPVLKTLESALAPLAPRPHWGKLSTMSGEVLRSRFERLGAVGELARPTGTPTASSATAFVDAALG